jgi:universal stress protein A
LDTENFQQERANKKKNRVKSQVCANHPRSKLLYEHCPSAGETNHQFRGFKAGKENRMKTIRLPKTRPDFREASSFAPQSILVPLDFSPLSETALQRACEIAEQFGSKLTLLHAVEPIVSPAEYTVVPLEMADVNVQLLGEHKTRLTAIQDRLLEDGLDCQVEVKLGKPWQVITDEAKNIMCDLIVIATHGRTGAKHFLMGSTAERVVQHAPCSVLVVR